jgi:hypothetical protein
MLVPFVIDADSVSPDPSWTPANVVICHQSLLATWGQIGLLLFEGSAFEKSRLSSTLEQLPPKLRSLWISALEHMPARTMGIDWDGMVLPDRIPLFGGRARVALVEDARAEIDFGLAEDELTRISAQTDGIEICRVEAAAQASAFAQALALSDAHIENGQSYREIWSQRFLALAAAPIKQISIVDRYAISQHFNCSQTYLSGLERFLRLIDADACGDRYITLYSGWTTGLKDKKILLQDVEEEIRSMLDKLVARNVRQITIYMLPNPYFALVSHDRFIRFGDHHVWDLGLGLKVLEGPACSERSAAAFKTGLLLKSYRATESELRGYPQAKPIKVKAARSSGSHAPE